MTLNNIIKFIKLNSADNKYHRQVLEFNEYIQTERVIIYGDKFNRRRFHRINHLNLKIGIYNDERYTNELIKVKKQDHLKINRGISTVLIWGNLELLKSLIMLNNG